MRLVNESGKRADRRGSRSMRRPRGHISSIFAKLGHNEPPNTQRRVAAVLDYLGAASR